MTDDAYLSGIEPAVGALATPRYASIKRNTTITLTMKSSRRSGGRDSLSPILPAGQIRSGAAFTTRPALRRTWYPCHLDL